MEVNYLSNGNKPFSEWIKENENKWISAGVVAGCIAIAMPFIVYFSSGSTLTADSFAKLGTVGDFLGGTTVGLLSLASILFLISTIVMQRKELGMQREELQMTREELAKANEQYEITNKTMLKQQFENTFFNLLDLFSKNRDEITIYDFSLETLKNESVVGIHAIKAINSTLNFSNRSINAKILRDYFKSSPHEEKILTEDLVKIIKRYNIDVIDNIYNLLDLLKNDESIVGTKLLTYSNLISEINLGSEDRFTQYIKHNSTKYFKDEYLDCLGNMNSNYSYPLLNYFELLKIILNLIDISNLEENEKDTYIEILIARITKDEFEFISDFIDYEVDKDIIKFANKFSKLRELRVQIINY